MKDKQQDYRVEKYIRYGIRKYSFGAASVAVAAGLMFLVTVRYQQQKYRELKHQ
ncbi:YSIRK-type signal peptide-containing protein [Streptococcus mitis]|uniref:YSIRK-type signal peptide-containing protein n=1 Tax=Streptococcus mitis TaxID=28037 RepID=UPI003B025909